MTVNAGSGDDRPVSEVLRDRNPQARLQLLERTDLRPEVLFFLASDPDPGVRRAVASRQALPSRLLSLLAVDSDPEIRGMTVARVADLLPDLTRTENRAAQNAVTQVLSVLSRDQLPQVRRLLADLVKDREDVPVGVVETLARDEDKLVSTVVLEYSPKLSDDFLMSIIGNHPLTASLVAIARRRSLAPQISDAIVQTETPEAIGALLANNSAQIREDTLDRIVAMAPSYPGWHTALVRRENLPDRLILEIATFVSEKLLDELADRAELSAETTVELRRAMAERLTETVKVSTGPVMSPVDVPLDQVEAMQTTAETMARAELVTVPAVMDSVEKGRFPLALAMIAYLGNLDVPTVVYALRVRDPRSWLAVLWMADIPPVDCESLQATLAGVPPEQILRATESGDYAITADERDWHIRLCKQKAKEAL